MNLTHEQIRTRYDKRIDDDSMNKDKTILMKEVDVMLSELENIIRMQHKQIEMKLFESLKIGFKYLHVQKPVLNQDYISCKYTWSIISSNNNIEFHDEERFDLLELRKRFAHIDYKNITYCEFIKAIE